MHHWDFCFDNASLGLFVDNKILFLSSNILIMFLINIYSTFYNTSGDHLFNSVYRPKLLVQFDVIYHIYTTLIKLFPIFGNYNYVHTHSRLKSNFLHFCYSSKRLLEEIATRKFSYFPINFGKGSFNTSL